MKHCMFCGEPVGEGDWDGLGSGRVWVCASRECARELLYAHREIQEEAQRAAMEDGYGRYMS